MSERQEQFSQKVALVTGGGSGIGRATALEFASRGAAVAVIDIDEQGGRETVEMAGDPDRVFFFRADVASEADVAAMVEATVALFGRLDVAFNNAARAFVGPRLHEVPEEQWDEIHDVDLKGVWLCMKHEITQMLGRGGGAIVNTSSNLALVSIPHQSAYCAAKAGVLGLTRSGACEYGKDGIRVNALLPGIVLTPMVQYALETDPEVLRPSIEAHPIGRVGEPEELAAAAVWLCSDEASFVTGHSMVVDGGFSVTPI